MKYLAAATVLFILCVFSLFVYYTVEVLAMGWGLGSSTPSPSSGGNSGRYVAGRDLHVTWFGDVERVHKRLLPAIGLLALVLGSKSVAFLVALIFEQDVSTSFRRTMPWPTSVKPRGTGIQLRHPVDVVAGFRRGDERVLCTLANRVASMEVTRNDA